jgi:hypothetical protein
MDAEVSSEFLDGGARHAIAHQPVDLDIVQATLLLASPLGWRRNCTIGGQSIHHALQPVQIPLEVGV